MTFALSLDIILDFHDIKIFSIQIENICSCFILERVKLEENGFLI